ncbi:protoheme IX farnesyltransferase [Natronosporangium hydrolyticum]|uniref:Protoheme IX farnesyltransferase n=1 Tax=Natronosporangium hydrolyticum TaxID=2811111 RepID=A0A895YBV0_9ACTN|nr:heme o synthase [Natronosporangium hydrolyticum]QSB12923.1 protoheme IX farnesyltransferase [Natronosporangium hydrolyticum]
MSSVTVTPTTVPAARVGAADPPTPQQPVPVPVTPRPSVGTLARAYLALTKPRIVELLLVTTLPTMILAAGGLPPIGLAVAVLVAGALAAGAANAINCYIDRDIDQLMRRTARRPLPTHTLQPANVLGFGLVLAVVSVGLMAVFANLLAAALTLGAIVYYDLIYTRWLKRTTPHNTMLGGVSGAAPVLIGWAAVTGSLAAPAWLLFAVVFLWQPPHFYALALRFKDDYARAGVPMLPVVASARRVSVESVGYVWLTVAASVALWPLGMGPVYGVAALVVGAVFVVEAHRLDRRCRQLPASELRPMRLFHVSTTYLTVLFVAVAVDAFLFS